MDLIFSVNKIGISLPVTLAFKRVWDIKIISLVCSKKQKNGESNWFYLGLL